MADIDAAITAIDAFVSGLDEERYFENDLVRSAVERKFEIIGEALKGLSKVRSDLGEHIRDFREIIAFRNVLAHGYATVDHGLVWRIIAEELPELRRAVRSLLDKRSH